MHGGPSARSAPSCAGAGGIAVRLVGTFDAAAGSEDYWYHAPSVLIPQIVYNDLVLYLRPRRSSLGEPVVLPARRGPPPARYPFEPATMAASDTDDGRGAVRTFTANAVTVGDGAAASGRCSRCASTPPRSSHARPGPRCTQAAMAEAAVRDHRVGAAGAAVAVLAVACCVIARSRRPGLAGALRPRRSSGRRVQRRRGTAPGSAPFPRSSPRRVPSSPPSAATEALLAVRRSSA